MSGSIRTRNRWFAATMAAACFSGLALEGCARTGRDLSAGLPEKAAEEAIVAERHSAERRRLESTSTRSKEVIAKNQSSRDSDPVAREKWSLVKPSGPRRDTATASSDKSGRAPRVALADSELDTADWSGEEELDRQIKTVADSRLDEESNDVEPLLSEADEVREVEAAVDIWDQEDTDAEAIVRVPAVPKTREAPTVATKKPSASKSASGEHPWADKAPVLSRSDREAAAAPTTPRAPAQPPASVVAEAAVAAKPAARAPKPSEADDDGKSAIRTMLAKGHDLLDEGELRRAFTVAQLAQRMADSRNVFFSPGEEQPADLIRSIQMRMRSVDSPLEMAQAEPETPPSKPSAKVISRVSASRSQPRMPREQDDWSFADWQGDQSARPAMAEVDLVDPAPRAVNPMRITPGGRSERAAVTRSRSSQTPFPDTRTEWSGERAAPLREAVEERTTTHDRFEEEHVVQPVRASVADRSSYSEIDSRQDRLDTTQTEERSPELAQADWRTQSLDNVGGPRQPLLAPLPTALEPIGSEILALDEEIVAVDLDEPEAEPARTKLWLMISAAAAAILLLVTRRRPIAVPLSDSASSGSIS